MKLSVLIIKLSNRGPMPVYNDSPLDLEVSMKLGITGLTIRSLGESEESLQDEQFYRLLGPIPVPDLPEYFALGLSFPSPEVNSDSQESFFLIMILEAEFKDQIYTHYDNIQQLTSDFVKTIKTENEIIDGIRITGFKSNFRQKFLGSKK